MKLQLTIAWRNIWRHRRRSLIVFLSISLGMAMMMMYDGLMAGFMQAIYANAVKVMGGNIQVYAVGHAEKADNSLLPLENDQAVIDAALAQPQVVAAGRRIQTGGMATSREGAFSVSIIGIEPEAEQSANLVAQNVSKGRYLTADDLDSIFIGKGLADAMNITVGDRITMAGQSKHSQMKTRTMTVVGIYDVGLIDIEKQTIYISLKEAQELYGFPGQSTEVVIYLRSIGGETDIISKMKSNLTKYEYESWQTSFPELRKIVTSKSTVMNIFSVIILSIAGIGILNLLLIAVYERTREIGIMGAIGMKPGQISSLFLIEGALMGIIGVILGVLLGLFINLLLGKVGLDYSQFSNLSSYTALISGRVYSTLGVEKLPMRVITVLIISVLAAYYPAREAAHKEPAEALHYV